MKLTLLKGNRDSTLSDEALRHFVRIQSGDATQDDIRCFESWRAADPAHANAYDQLRSLWVELDGAVELAVSSGELAPSQSTSPRSVRRAPLVAAAALVCVIASGVWMTGALTALFDDYHTGIGKQETVTLADGSTVYLDTGSALSVEFSPERRHVTLRKGQALFDVARDPNRPFEVAAANGTIRALGTKFNVYTQRDRVTVTVVEHAVQVSLGNGDGTEHGATRVSQRQFVDYNVRGLSEVKQANLNAVTAWRRGKLVFDARPLGEVIDEVNRYRSGKIVILDQPVRDIPVGGMFDVADPDGVLQAIERTLPVRSIRVTHYLVLLRGKP